MLVFVIVFILIVITGLILGPRLVNKDTPAPKEPLDLEYDVNLPDDREEPVSMEKETPDVTKSVSYPVPDLNRSVVIYNDIPEETQIFAKGRIAALTETLRKDTSFADDWIELGTYRKLIGDIDAALEIWRYASVLSPNSSVSYNNIAVLYASYIHDYPKAEEYYLKAISSAPDLPYPYFAAFEFYKSILKDDKKAEDIVRQGIAAVPGTKAELEQLLAP